MVQFGNIPTKLRKKGLEDKLMRVCQDNDVIYMGIFGSYVRGEQKRGSDIDIAIRYRKGARKSLFDLVELQLTLSRVFGRKVDLGEFDCINPYIIDDVKRRIKVIYKENPRHKVGGLPGDKHGEHK
jgi:predicted nucleotidyltransferase